MKTPLTKIDIDLSKVETPQERYDREAEERDDGPSEFWYEYREV